MSAPRTLPLCLRDPLCYRCGGHDGDCLHPDGVRVPAALLPEDAGPLSPEAVAWLCDGDQGGSSRYMFRRLALRRPPEIDRYAPPRPWDLADFRRCELLLRAVPGLRDRLPEMAGDSEAWGILVHGWQRVVEACGEGCFDGSASARNPAAAVWRRLGL